MGKLTFKGDKKKKKRKVESEKNSDEATINSKKPKLDFSVVSGWTSSINERDLDGPCIFVLPDQTKPTMLSFNEELDTVLISKDKYKVNEISTNFLGDDGQDIKHVPLIHKIEPTSVNQVFTIIPIKQKGTSILKKDTNITQFALKNYKNKYLEVNPSTNKVETSFAISKNSIFELKKDIKYNEEFKINEVLWSIISKERKKILTFNDKELIVSSEDSYRNKHFVIRIQVQNSSKYKLAKLLKEDEENIDVKKVIKDLYDETSGKIKITEDLIKRIKLAIKEGTLNEQIIEEKEMLFSRW